jgi:hypothetical protein
MQGSYVFVADSHTLQVVDISDVDDPRTVSTLDLPEPARLSIEQGLLYVIMDHACWVMDIDNPNSPLILRKVAGRRPDRLDGEGTTAYHAGGFFGIDVYDVSDRAAPVLLRTIKTADSAYDLVVHAGQLLVADGTCGIQVFELSDPTRPRCIGHVETPGKAYELAIAPSGALVADDIGGLQIVPLPCPTTAVTVQDFFVEAGEGVVHLSWHLADPGGITKQRLRGYADGREWDVSFVTQRSGAFAAVDPVGFSSGGSIRYDLSGRETDGRWVTLVSREIDIRAGAGRLGFEVWPNPARGAVEVRFASAPTRAIDLGVFSVDGRRVATLATGRLVNRTSRVLWSGIDARGERLPSGIYWVRLRIGQQVHSRKLLLVR